MEKNLKKLPFINSMYDYTSKITSAAAAADKMIVHIKTKLNKSNFWLRITGCFVTSAGSPLTSDVSAYKIKYVYIQIKMHGISNSEVISMRMSPARETRVLLRKSRDSFALPSEYGTLLLC